MPWGRYCCLEPVSEQAGAASVLGEWFWLGRSVASVSASASGAGGLVEWSVVDGLAEVDLPGFGLSAPGVPGVEADEVVADERDGHEHGCRDESGLSEESAIDAQPLVAVGADETPDEGAPIEGERPAAGLPGSGGAVVPPVASSSSVIDRRAGRPGRLGNGR